MLFAPTLADRAILPTAWRGRYFFNRIGRLQPVVKRRKRVLAVAHVNPHTAACDKACRLCMGLLASESRALPWLAKVPCEPLWD
ncbi:hypothetical protein EGJ28_22765 [Stutzerimonas xanthomarina]|uniref:Uncharacterized protein n=1 Tax=Stutzerimonas xanthomarina TaxID=271420 RepID=A0A3R8U322_9GAMM|nr:hypothetical protein EGJ28_22765 [Stutzerimonas xanthomarina]RRV65370.1 hypothetical protein EGI99_18590 [Stutzerimonas stutzeri]